MVRLFFFYVLWLSQSANAAKIAFLGDSLSTGGGAHPKISLDSGNFKELLSGKLRLDAGEEYFQIVKGQGFTFSGAQAPVRLSRSYREYQHPLFWFVDNLWVSFSANYLDSEEYSWSYLMARELGYDPRDILIAAQDGERMVQGTRQVDRLLDKTQSQLPKDIFVFFSGNDLCGPSLEYVTTGEKYAEQLKDLLRYIKINGKPAIGGTTVHVLNPLSILQIVTSSAILSKEVSYKGQKKSCREIQTLKPEDLQQTQPTGSEPDPMDMFISLVASAPSNYCSTLFSIHKGNSKHQLAMSNRLNSYRTGIEQAVKEFNDVAGIDIIANHIQESRDLLFEGDDIANDCFHLSLSGHAKLAKVIKTALEAGSK